MFDLVKSIRMSASGMQTQGVRLRVISENVANANSLPQNPGDQPYQRKLVLFKNVLDRAIQGRKVQIDKIIQDRSEFGKKYDPSHPAADAEGYVMTPNVNGLVEMMDMREAQRSYEANLAVIETSKGMLVRTIDLLRD